MTLLPTFAVHAVIPAAVMASTLPSAFNAKMSATPVELGTAGIIQETPEPSPGFDQMTVLVGNVGPAQTVTFADAPPAVIVDVPTPTAVIMGGSSVERVTTSVSLELQARPVTGWLLESRAWMACVPPTTILMGAGTNWAAEVSEPRVGGTVNVRALLDAPFCWTCTMPLTAPEATDATICVSLHPITEPKVLPIQTLPPPWGHAQQAPDELLALADDLRAAVVRSGIPAPAIRKVLDMK